jgi:hypothetical protein
MPLGIRWLKIHSSAMVPCLGSQWLCIGVGFHNHCLDRGQSGLQPGTVGCRNTLPLWSHLCLFQGIVKQSSDDSID